MKTFKQFFVGLMLVGMLSGHVSAAIGLDRLIQIAQNLSARIQANSACLSQEEIEFLNKDQTLIEQFNEIEKGNWKAVHAILQARVTSLMQSSVQVFVSEREEEEEEADSKYDFNGMLPLWVYFSDPRFLFAGEDVEMTDGPLALSDLSREEETDVPAASSSSSNSLPFVPQLEDFASEDPYELLGVNRGDKLDVINRRVRNLLRRYHPDKNPNYVDISTEITKKILNAHRFVTDDTMKRMAAESAAPSSSSQQPESDFGFEPTSSSSQQPESDFGFEPTSSSSQQSESRFGVVFPVAGTFAVVTPVTTAASYPVVDEGLKLGAHFLARHSGTTNVAYQAQALLGLLPELTVPVIATGIGLVAGGFVACKTYRRRSQAREEKRDESKKRKNRDAEQDEENGCRPPEDKRRKKDDSEDNKGGFFRSFCGFFSKK